MLQRVDRGGVLAQLEVHLRRRDAARHAGERYDLAAPHLVARLYLQLAVVGVDGDPAIGVADQEEIPVALSWLPA